MAGSHFGLIQRKTGGRGTSQPGLLMAQLHSSVPALAILVLEILFPKSRYPAVSRIRGAIFLCSYFAINALIFPVIYRQMGALGMKPLFTVDLSFLSASAYSPLRFIGAVATTLRVNDKRATE
jgi:hypothetical protein